MKKGTFTLLLIMSITFGYSQGTYYWVGGIGPISFTANSSWNTQQDGNGDTRVASDAADILIFDGANIGGTANTTGPVVAITSSTAMGKLVFQNGADVAFTRTTSGTATITVGDDPFDDDLIVKAGCKLRMTGTTGSVLVVLKNNATANNATPATTSATALIQGEIIMEQATTSSTAQNRFTSRLKNSFVFASGSKLTTMPDYLYYAFGSAGSSVTPIANGVVFESGSSYYHNGGLSPFGSNSISFHVNFKPGSNFYFRAPAATNMFSGRVYGNVIVQNNTALVADGSLARIEDLMVEAGSTFTLHTSGTTPVNGNIVNNGNLMVPAANPDRNNKLVMIGSSAQSIGGTGTFSLSDFIVSDVSNVTLNHSITVDTATVIIGVLNPNGFSINGPGSTTLKSLASVISSGKVNVDSFLVKNIVDFTGIEIGMSVSSSPNIAEGTVIAGLSASSGTISLSKPAIGSTYSTGVNLIISNGSGVVLPIKFTNISASVNNTQALVNWSILQETNIAHYVVERSAANNSFTQIGIVAAGNLGNYSFTDNSPLAGVNLYRIKAVSKDGEIKYSAIVNLRISKDGIKLELFPNPVRDVLSISGMQPKDQLSIVDMKGRVLMMQPNANSANSTTINIARLPNGQYVLKVTGETGIQTKTFIKQ